MTSWSLELMDFRNVSILEIVRQGLFCSHISFCLFVGTSQLSLMSWVTESMLCLIELRLVIWPWENNTFAAIGEKKTVSPFLHQHPFGSHIENSSEVLPNAISKPGIENCGVVQRQKCVISFLKKVSLFQIQTCKICQVKEGNDGDNF